MLEKYAVRHHGSLDIREGDKASIRFEVVHDTVVVHDGLRNARLPNATCANERNMFAFEDLRDDLLNNLISSYEYSRS